MLGLSGAKATGTGTGASEETCHLLHGQTQPKPPSAPFLNLKLVIFNSSLVFE